MRANETHADHQDCHLKCRSNTMSNLIAYPPGMELFIHHSEVCGEKNSLLGIGLGHAGCRHVHLYSTAWCSSLALRSTLGSFFYRNSNGIWNLMVSVRVIYPALSFTLTLTLSLSFFLSVSLSLPMSVSLNCF